MRIDEVRMIIQAVEDRSAPTPRFSPGTVVFFDRENAVATVRMDGQEFGDEIDVRPLVADIGNNDRVMIAYDPPRGGYIIGHINRPYSAGEVVNHVERTTTETGVTNAAPAILLSAPVTFLPSRRYRVEFAGQATAASGTPRAQLRLLLTTLDGAGSSVDTVLQTASISLASGFTGPITKSVIVQPGDVTGTLRLQGRETLPSGSVNFAASSESPAYITVTDVGPALVDPAP